MCNLGEMIARENIEKGHSMGLEQGQKLERRKKNIELITNLMNSLSISFSKAVELLKVSEDEVLEIKNILKLNGICWQGRYFVLAFIFDDKK